MQKENGHGESLLLISRDREWTPGHGWMLHMVYQSASAGGRKKGFHGHESLLHRLSNERVAHEHPHVVAKLLQETEYLRERPVRGLFSSYRRKSGLTCPTAIFGVVAFLVRSFARCRKFTGSHLLLGSL